MLVTRLQHNNQEEHKLYSEDSYPPNDGIEKAVAKGRWKGLKQSSLRKLRRLTNDSSASGDGGKEVGDDFAAVVAAAQTKQKDRRRQNTLFGKEELLEHRKAVHESDNKHPWWHLKAERRAVREFFEDPHSSKPAFYMAIFILLMIVASSVTFCTETLPEVQDSSKAMDIIKVCDYIFIGVFTLEYLIRLLVSENPVKFVVQLANGIDLLSILPFYIDLIIQEQGVDLRFLRLARVFRVFKLSRYGNKMQMVVDALKESKDILGMLAVNLVIVIIVFSSITYFAEKDHPKDTYDCPLDEFPDGCSKFKSIYHACWWCIVTVLTVGYGDMAPYTLWGKMTATLLMVLSLIVLALPITIIGSCFSNQWIMWKSMNKVLKDLYPLLMRYLEEYSDHNYLMREKMGDTIVSVDKLRRAIKSKDYPSQQDHMAKIKGATDTILLAMDERLMLMSGVIDDVLQKISDQQRMSGGLKTEADRVLGDAENVLRAGLLEMINQEVAFRDKEKKLKDFSGLLIVHVVGGRGLVARDMSGTSDPYVKLVHGNEEATSHVVEKSLSPLFEETLVLLLRNLVEPLHLEVFDKDLINSDDTMGHASIDLAELVDREPREEWAKLQGVDHGEVKVVLTFRTFEGIDAEDLESPATWNVLCSLLLGCEDPRDLDMASALESIRKEAVPGAGGDDEVRGSEAVMAMLARAQSSDSAMQGGAGDSSFGSSAGGDSLGSLPGSVAVGAAAAAVAAAGEKESLETLREDSMGELGSNKRREGEGKGEGEDAVDNGDGEIEDGGPPLVPLVPRPPGVPKPGEVSKNSVFPEPGR